MPKPFNLKRLLAHGPELIEAERVFIREIPLQELGLTVLYVVVSSIWCVFSTEMLENIMGTSPHSAALETLEGRQFCFCNRLGAVPGAAAELPHAPISGGGAAA
jgi:hypothetical protein